MKKDKQWYLDNFGEKDGFSRWLRGSSLEAYIFKFGEKDGTIKFNGMKSARKGRGNLQWFINKYGEIEGPIKYREINYKKTINEQKFIEKYGEIGAQLYHEMVIKRSMAIRACVSKPELELGMAINEMFPADDIRFNDTQVTIGLRRSEAVILGQRAIKPDILIANKKIIIEFYGDIFHAHSRFIDTVFPCPWIQLTAKEIRQHDQAKIKLLEKYGYTVFIVWEYDWRKNKNLVLKNLREKINEIKK